MTAPEAQPSPGPVGPLSGLEWHPTPIAPGTLLHDDGQRLWAVPLQGPPEPRWTHPKQNVYMIASAPGGTEIAIVASPPAQNVSFLYLLGADGSVSTVRETTTGWSIWTPIFVRAPTEPQGEIRLYWVEHSDGEFDMTTDTPVMRVMEYDGTGVHEVRVPLLWGTAPFQLSAYPGDTTSTLVGFRRNNIPTRYQILRNADRTDGGSASSPTTWGYWDTITDTDVYTDVAWLSPDEYVVAYGHSHQQESNVPTYSLKLYRVGCEWAGSVTFWSGTTLDPGVSGALWQMLSPDPEHVLVLSRQASQVVNTGHGETPWLLMDVRTGRMSRTDAMWSPTGAWTVVRAAERPSTGGNCGGVHWAWP